MFGPESDKKLINRALNGSQSAWIKLVKRHEKRVYNYCLRMTLNNADAMDLMQDIFLAVYRNSPGYRGESKFSSWLMGIASNKTIDFLRSRQRNPLFNAYDMQETYLSTPEGPQDEMTIKEENRRVLSVMAQLPDEQRLVVELKFFQHLTFEEIAGRTGVPINTVKTRLYTSLRKLRSYLEMRNAV